LAWSGDRRVKPRTQASLGISANGKDWLLINASPDLPEQLRRSPALHPGGGNGGGARGSPIKSILLTGAEIDQVTGLLSLREREPFVLCASAATHAVVRANSVFDVLAPDIVERRTIKLDQPCELPGDLMAELFAVPGKVPLYLEGENPETMSETAGTVGAEISAGGARLVYIPGAAAITPGMRKRLERADVLFFDGTLFRDDEMIASRTDRRRAAGWAICRSTGRMERSKRSETSRPGASLSISTIPIRSWWTVRPNTPASSAKAGKLLKMEWRSCCEPAAE